MVSGHRVDVGVGEVVRYSGGGCVARRNRPWSFLSSAEKWISAAKTAMKVQRNSHVCSVGHFDCGTTRKVGEKKSNMASLV